jgi:hypothetical protein
VAITYRRRTFSMKDDEQKIAVAEGVLAEPPYGLL